MNFGIRAQEGGVNEDQPAFLAGFQALRRSSRASAFQEARIETRRSDRVPGLATGLDTAHTTRLLDHRCGYSTGVTSTARALRNAGWEPARQKEFGLDEFSLDSEVESRRDGRE